MEFPRAKREGETKVEYEAALQELVKRCLAKEFPGDSTPVLKSTNTAEAPSAGSSHVLSEYTTAHQLKWYKKTSGAADGAGNDYEWKMLTLVFLRMLDAGHEFQLASNMEAAGLFDDIVLKYRKNPQESWRVIYLQLKHKQKKTISKSSLLGLSGDFSLAKYCCSYKSLVSDEKKGISFDKHQLVIFTNASVNDFLVDAVQSDEFFSTGGKALSFKPGGEIFRGLCEWVDFKEALTNLHSQVDGMSEDEVATRIKEALQSAKYQNICITSFQDDLLKTPKSSKLRELLTKLDSVGDKNTYSTFLTKLHIYTNQVHESKLDARIKEEVAKVWKCNVDMEASAILHSLQDKVKSWWQKDNFYLTQDSQLWHDAVKLQTENISKSTISGLSKIKVVFEENCLQELHNKINKIATVGGILNLRVDSRTAASSLRVHQALAKFHPNEIVLHLNVKALLEREEDVMSAWATRWCRILVVECDDLLDQSQAGRISKRILNVIERKYEIKLIVLIAAEKHELNLQLYHAESYKSLNDNCEWGDLTEMTRHDILATEVVINDSRTSSLSDLLGGNKGLDNKANLELISQFLNEEFCFGKGIFKESKHYVTRKLTKSSDSVTFFVNSVSDVREKVALLVAEPGMGKSTLITHLANSAKKEDPSAWIVHIKLNDCVQYLKDINVDHFNEFTAKMFLEQAALCPANNLEKLLFGVLRHKLVVFVDGVDEVCPHYEEQVFLLLSFLKDMKFSRLWVTSRPVFQKQLEATLEVSPLYMVAFSEGDRTDFFNKVWMEKFPAVTREKYSEVTESLLAWMNDSLGKDNPILGVPLMAAMVAEIFQEQMFDDDRKYVKNQRLDLMNLYSTFVKKKFDLYCVEKKKTPSRELAANIDDEESLLRQMHHRHRLAALRVLFSREEIADLQFEGKEKFDQDLATYLKEVSDGREKLGIIDNVIDGHPHFVHRSFAEYFAASWLALHFKDNKRFVERIIFDPAYKLLSEMFQRALTEGHPLHFAVVNRDFQSTKSILKSQPNSIDVDKVDAGGRTALHLAVIFSGTDGHRVYRRIVEYLIQRHRARLNVADEVLGWPPLRYAEWSRAWRALHIMLEKVGTAGIRASLSFMQKQEGWPRPDPSLMLDAARDASVLVVSYLVEVRGGKLNCRGKEGETMIHRAVEGQNVEMLKYLHKKGQSLRYLLSGAQDLEVVNKHGLNVFQFAAQRGAYQVMACLLELKATFNVSSTAKPSLVQLNASLLCAAFAGSLKSVKNLVAMGASNDHRDNKGNTAACIAMYQEHIDVMDWLLLRTSKDGETPLHGACAKGELEIVKFILARGADIEARGWLGRTPLMAAVASGRVALMELLLEKGADAECRDISGDTVLHDTCRWGSQQAVELLQRHGSNIHCVNNKGESVLHAASQSEKSDVVEMLLEKGLSSDCRDIKGNTPLHTACLAGSKEAVEVLLRHGANIKEENDNGETPLHAASYGGKADVMELLLEVGADVECRNEHGNTPLHIVSWLGSNQCMELLLRHGADINSVNDKGETPLHAAFGGGKAEAMDLLLKTGASVDCPDNNGNTPLHKASLDGLEMAVQVLCSHDASVNTRIVARQLLNQQRRATRGSKGSTAFFAN